MENASKALLMAAGVLIGIMILSLAVYLFTTFGTSSAQMHKQIETDRLNEFNSQFTSYEGKDGITIYDVISVANLAKENNQYYELNSNEASENNFCVKVYIGNTSMEGNTTEENNEIISKEVNTEMSTYDCKAYISQKTGRVYKVVFTKK